MDRQQLSRRSNAPPSDPDQPKREPVPASCRLSIELAEELLSQIRIAELREVGDRRTQLRYEVEASRPLANFFGSRELVRPQKVMDVDQPLAARHGNRASARRAREEQLVSRVEDDGRGFDLGELERPPAEET